MNEGENKDEPVNKIILYIEVATLGKLTLYVNLALLGFLGVTRTRPD